MPIKFRPHHFMCTLGFQGMGYSKYFIRNYQKIYEQLTLDPDTPIEVVKGLDGICGACPHQRTDDLCDKQQLIETLDRNHQAILGISINQTIRWRAAKELIKEKMTLKNFHEACEDCEWKKLGVCERALKNLLETN